MPQPCRVTQTERIRARFVARLLSSHHGVVVVYVVVVVVYVVVVVVVVCVVVVVACVTVRCSVVVARFASAWLADFLWAAGGVPRGVWARAAGVWAHACRPHGGGRRRRRTRS